MDILKGVYVAVLATLVLLSGCLGSGIFDTSEGEGEDNGNGTGTSGGGSGNMAPLIEVVTGSATGGTPTYSSTSGELTGYSEYNVSLYRAITDLDGNITSAGWDFDLDGQIDHSSTDFRAVDNLSILSSNWVNASTISGYGWAQFAGGESGFDWDDLEDIYGFNDFQIATIAFIATDDDGAVSAELLTINNLYFHLYLWAEEEAAQPPPTSANTYDADDANADATTGTSDILMRLQLTGADDYNWAFVQIRLSVGDNVYSCSIGGGDACTISQQGGDNGNAWEPGEFIFLSESGTDICGDVGCSVGISVTYNGNTVPGDGSVIVD